MYQPKLISTGSTSCSLDLINSESVLSPLTFPHTLWNGLLTWGTVFAVKLNTFTWIIEKSVSSGFPVSF